MKLAIGTLFLKSSLTLMACILVNKLLGFAEKALIARSFGTSPESDAILMAQSLFLTGWLIIEEVLAPALIPVLHAMRDGREEAGSDRGFTGLILVSTLPLIIAIVLVPLLFPDSVANLLYPGFPSETRKMVIDLWQLFSLGCLPYFLTPILQAFAHAHKIFFLPALSQLFGRLAMLACFLLFIHSLGIAATGWGVIAYGLVHALLMAAFLRFPGKQGLSSWPAMKPFLVQFSYLAFPLFLGLSFSQVCHWVDLRLTSTLPAGAVSALAYARKLVDVPVILGAFCLGIVLLPYLSDFFSRAQYHSFRLYFSRCFWVCAFLYLLLGLGYVLGGQFLVEWFFGGGRFGEQSSGSVTYLVRLFAFGLPVFALEILIMQAAFAMLMHWQAILTGIVCASLNIGFTLWLFPRFGIAVIPIALVAQKAAKCIILGLVLLRKLRAAESSPAMKTAAVSTLA